MSAYWLYGDQQTIGICPSGNEEKGTKVSEDLEETSYLDLNPRCIEIYRLRLKSKRIILSKKL